MGIFNRKDKTEKLAEAEVTLNNYLSEYLTSLLNLSKAEKISGEKFSSYMALAKMEGDDELENGEKKRQEKLVDKSCKMGYDCILAGNRKNPNKISFCQFSTQGYSINNNKTEYEKLYLNCDRDKVAEISKKLMKKAKKENLPLTFKIAYEDGISDNYKRSEKIVIYTEEEIQKEAVINILKNIDKKNKGLFNRKKRIPLMPKIEGAGFIFSPGKQSAERITTYTSIENCTTSNDNTWNAMIASALEESFMYGCEIINGTYKPDHHKYFFSNEDKLRRYVQDYWYNMDDEKRTKIYECMKEAMIKQCEKNKIKLDPDLKQKEMEKNSFCENLENGVKTDREIVEKNTLDQREIKAKSQDEDVMSY